MLNILGKRAIRQRGKYEKVERRQVGSQTQGVQKWYEVRRREVFKASDVTGRSRQTQNE